MKVIFFRLALTVLFSACWANIGYAGGGHVHFGRSEFVNGGMTPAQISNSLTEIEAKTHDIEELIQAGNLLEIEELAVSIRDISHWIVDNAGMNQARHANLKRASKSISKAAEKLKKYAVTGDASKAKEQVERIHKFLEFVV